MLSRITFSIILIFIACGSSLISQTSIIAKADRYYYGMKNNSQHHLVISQEGGFNSDPEIYRPGNLFVRNKYLSKRKLKRTKIICTYNSQTHALDKAIIDRKFEQEILAANNYRHRSQSEVRDVIGKRLIAEVAAQSNPTTWIGKGAKYLGLAYKKISQFSDFINFFNKKNYSTYQDFFIDAAVEFGKSKLIDEFSDMVDQQSGLSIKPTKFVINTLGYFYTQDEIIDKHYRSLIDKANAYKSSETSKIDLYLEDSSFSSKNTYSAYDLVSKPINWKTRSPRFLIDIEPLIYGDPLNDRWLKPEEKFLENTGNQDQYKFGNATYNRSFAGSVKIAISPELNLSKSLYSRLYGGVTYSNTAYAIKEGYTLTTNFFGNIPQDASSFTISDPLTLDDTRVGLELNWRLFLGKFVMLDINGGYASHSGKINLSTSSLRNGFTWSRENILFSSKENQTFYGAKLGLGRNRFGKGFHFIFGIQFYRVNHYNETDYMIEELGSDVEVDYTSGGRLLRKMTGGVSFAF